jgi:alcohol dehydrogenase (cytochrome c)
MEAIGDPDRLQTSGGVLFTGDLNNDFLALDAKDGRRPLPLQHQRQHRWRRDLLFARKQYAAATSGTVSAFFGGSGPPAVIIFALP